MEKRESEPGTLFLVSTPIGNLEDISYRAVRILSESELIAAEDTRTSGRLLNHYGISTKVTSYHEHNKISKASYITGRILSGDDVCLITDAGTPGISDPGEELVRMALDEGITVTAVPGAAAFVAAAVTSGLPCRRIAFEAFLPKDKKKRRNVLESLRDETRTIIIYEAPHHLRGTLTELFQILGDRDSVLMREITKKFEERISGSLSELITRYESEEPKGEFVILLRGKSFEEIYEEVRGEWDGISLEEHYQKYLDSGHDRREAMRLVAKDRGLSKNEIYNKLKRG